MPAIIAVLGVIALIVLAFAFQFTVWASLFMLVAWLVSYPLTWAYAYAAGIVVSLVVTALRKAA